MEARNKTKLRSTQKTGYKIKNGNTDNYTFNFKTVSDGEDILSSYLYR